MALPGVVPVPALALAAAAAGDGRCAGRGRVVEGGGGRSAVPVDRREGCPWTGERRTSEIYKTSCYTVGSGLCGLW